MTMLNVAIIGAGPSGLAALRALRQEGCFNIRVFERRDKVGGVWIHDAHPARRKPSCIPATDPTAVDTSVRRGKCETWPSPMYDNLVTNIPARLMAYGDVPFAEQTALFPTRQTVLRYLEDFAHEHDLTRHIDFNTKVLSVKRVAQGWRITTMYEEAVTQSLFDRIVVASGHYETPLLPDIEGISDFDKLYPDVISHSKYYRSPEAFAHLKTVVVGNGPSGIDIVSQIAHTPGAQLPLLRSIRSSSKSPMPAAQVQDVAEIVAFCADRSLLLKDGTRITDVDRVLFCTGYLYAFPFLDAPRIVTNGLRLHKLYKQILWQDDPTLAFLGMEMSIVPFPYSEAQACYLARVWANRLTLPSKAIMQQEEAERVAIRGDGRGFMFRSHPEDGAYIQELRELCIQADEGHGKGKGLMPVDWSGDRFALRAQGPALRRAWLEEKEKRAS